MYRIACLLVVITSCAEAPLVPSRPPRQSFAQLREADLRDGVWAVEQLGSADDPGAVWPRYLIVSGESVGASGAVLRFAHGPTVVVPANCYGVTPYNPEASAYAFSCTRNSYLAVYRWGKEGRLVIRKRLDGRFTGEFLVGTSPERRVGTFQLRALPVQERPPN